MKELLQKLGFINLGNLHLSKLVIYLAGIGAGWYLLEGVIPEPWHDKLLKIIMFVAFVVGYVLKGEKPNNVNVDNKTNTNSNNTGTSNG